MTTPDPWDDDRLAAAFTARAATVPVPPDLATATTNAVRQRPTRRDAPWWRPLPFAAAAAVVVSVVGLSLAMSWRTGSSPPPTGPSASVPSAAPSDAETERVFGLPVIDVPAALAVRDVGEDDRELAVRGWYSPIGFPDQWVLSTTQVPTGDGFQIDLDGIDASDLPWGPAVRPAEPAEIVVVGHFDDRRSRRCPADVEQSCRDTFAVDRVDAVDGKPQPLSHLVMIQDGEPQSTLDEVLSAFAEAVPDAVVLSVVTADRANIVAIEPTLGDDQDAQDDGLVVAERNQWVLRTLEAGRPQTYVVTDGKGEVWRMDIDGNLFRVGGPIATPTPTEGPWPPPNTVTRFPLTSRVGTGLPPVEVAILDPTGAVGAAREVRDDDPVVERPDRSDGRTWVTGQPGDPRGIRLGWTGSLCDRHVIVTVDSLDSILIDGGLHPSCRMAAIERELVLTFREPVDASVVDVSYIETRTGASPPTGAHIVVLASPGAGGSPVRVVLSDLSGRVTSARAVTPADGPFNPTAPFWRLAPEGASSAYRLDWLGTSCDGDTPITVNADLSGINIVLGAVDLCDGAPVERSIVVEIQDGVDTTGVEVSYTVAIIDVVGSPEPTADQSPGAS